MRPHRNSFFASRTSRALSLAGGKRNNFWSLTLGLALLLFGVLQCGLPAAAQSSYGSVVGTVTDSTGAVLPGVTVSLVNTGTSEHHSVKSDEHGSYQFVNLLPGVYSIKFEHPGFKKMDRENVEVQTSTVARIDLAMEVGAVEQVVEVTSSAPAIDTQSSTVGAVIEGKVVEETPLNGRNVMNLIALAPGVVPQGSSSGSVQSNQHGGTFSNPAGWGNYQIGGGMAGQSATYVDGQPLNGTQNNSPVLVPAQDIVQEFRVETNTVSPEFGRFAGGVVNMTTKQGSNSFHGTAYEYLRNKVVNANDFFSKQADQPRAEWTQNQYGVWVGGPIKRDKAFFFGAWEGFRLRLGDPNTNIEVPTTAEMGGDFSALIGSGSPVTGTDGCGNTIYGQDPNNAWAIGSIYDPALHFGAPGTAPYTCVFAGNKMTYHDTTGSYLINHYYTPKTGDGKTVAGPNSAYNLWSGNGASGSDYDQITGRVDLNLSAVQRIFARYTNWVADTIAEDPFQNGYGKPGEKHQTHMAVLGDTYTINDKTIADLRLSYSGMHWDSMAPSAGRDMSVYGGDWSAIGGLATYKQNLDPGLPGNGPIWGLFMDVTQESYDNILSATGSLTRIAGRHTLKIGGEWRYTNYSNIADNSASGQYIFVNAPVYTHYAWSDLLLGTPINGTAQTTKEVGLQMFYAGAYVMDSYQMSQKLTLNYGVRWEQPGAFREHHDLNTVFLPNITDSTAGVGGSGTGEPGLLALVNSSDYKYLSVNNNRLPPADHRSREVEQAEIAGLCFLKADQ